MANQEGRVVGKTRDAGWQVGARRTLPVTPGAAWRLLTSGPGLASWLGDIGGAALGGGASYRTAEGAEGTVRVWNEGSHLRLTWQPGDWPRPSTVQVRVMPSGKKTVIAFHQEHMPGAAERAERQAFFAAALDRLAALVDEQRGSGNR